MRARHDEAFSLSKRCLPILLLAMATIAVSLLSLLPHREEGAPFGPLSCLDPTAAAAQNPRWGQEDPATEVGTGWSTHPDPEKAVSEALSMALVGKKHRLPHMLFLFATAGSDLSGILREVSRSLGPGVAVFGGTSDSRWVMSDKGLIRGTRRGYQQSMGEGKRALALMTVYSSRIRFGVGSAPFSRYRSPAEATRAALLAAMRQAGQPRHQRPRLILLLPTHGQEEEVVRAIESVVGRETPILGGTAGGPSGQIIGESRVYRAGVCVAAIYTDLPMAWVFEGGFETPGSHSGIATKVRGHEIVEIDHRPALQVYDQWLDGKIRRLYQEIGRPDAIRDLLVLNPLYRKYRSPAGQDHFLFSHPWPKDDTLKEQSIMTSTLIRKGDRLYLARGSWELLLNRIGNLPCKAMNALQSQGEVRALLGIGFICGGVMGAIPETEQEKIPHLIAYATPGTPFIAIFTWGEQGHFPSLGNRHGNLLTSFLVVGRRE
jgi:hypothetical protein